MPRPGRSLAIPLRPEPITFGNYCDGVRLCASHVKPLAGSLRVAAPGDLSRRARAQLDTIDDIAIAIDDIRTARQGSAAVKPAFDLLGAAFGATHDTLLAKSRLPGRATVSVRAPQRSTRGCSRTASGSPAGTRTPRGPRPIASCG
ncbi:hypothetical protein DB32_004650 [Sandaracinus amylolyticus]|uniref:Uncharacterized protein n=1 Tax=Sandaracinus amylolyticus TaxID=927083 RepID=A0A0F6YIY5_9BACT|nr:hypothetical protein DB32_004650 [Sandaracinus amylolyticus]